MDYAQIKRDVQEFKDIARSVGMLGYCFMGSLLLKCCLDDHRISCEVVKGYLIMHDCYWILHVWNKIQIEDKAHQIDVTYRVLNMPQQYTFTLTDKWESLIDTEEEQKDYDDIQETFTLYQTRGAKAALVHLANNLNHAPQWKMILDRLSTLPTFKPVKKYRKILCV